MPITPNQSAPAEQQQQHAAEDPAQQIRLVAGPGTGKSKTIERRVAHVLNGGANPQNVYVISFTRATCAELRARITAYCAPQPCAFQASEVRVSTMHALALRILRSANLLRALYPSDPVVLDDWERKNLYDIELASALGCTRGRAAEIRLAHDAQWQTLTPESIAQAEVTDAERVGFESFHATRRNLYSCVLPGEVIYECVHAIQQGAIQPVQLPHMQHLIVDEFQDLNACDQEFTHLLAAQGAILFIAGDDDQSIYSFRHANPDGVVQFHAVYPEASSHTLTECFRCSPAILTPATRLIAVNPNRLQKNLHALYGGAEPPVLGTMQAWSFASAQQEAAAIAESCQRLIDAGMAGHEDQILILISSRRLQLDLITQELANVGLPFDPPGGDAIRDEDGIRAAYSICRIVRDQSTQSPDYVAHRTLLSQLHGVGVGTARAVGDLCVTHNQNFHELFYLPALPPWLNGRTSTAVIRVRTMVQGLAGWTMEDTLTDRAGEIANLVRNHVFTGSPEAAGHEATWTNFVGTLPDGTTLEELLAFLAAGDEAEQRQILDAVNQRLGVPDAVEEPQRRIRILTMHGAKGLSGRVVFIPSAEQGIMPDSRAIQATGLLIERRRLFYVSVTRAMAACLVSHARLHTGAQAALLQQRAQVRLTRSQFLNEMQVPSANRVSGLNPAEAMQIVTDINNL